MRKRASPAARVGYSVRRWTCAAFLPYRALAHSAGCLIAAAAHHFLRYRGPVRNGKHLPNGKPAVFLPHRFVRKLAVCCCAAQTDFLPYRIAEKPEQTDVLLSAAVRLLCSEPAQRYCAAEQIPFAHFVLGRWSDDLVFLHCRRGVLSFGVWQVETQDCLALRLGQPPFRAFRVVHQAAVQKCCAAVRIRSVPSVPARYCCDTTFLRRRPADWCCAVDLRLPFFLPYRAKQSRCDSAPTRCCADEIPTGNVRPVPAAYSARPRRPCRAARFLHDDTAHWALFFLPRVLHCSLASTHAPVHVWCRAAQLFSAWSWAACQFRQA